MPDVTETSTPTDGATPEDRGPQPPVEAGGEAAPESSPESSSEPATEADSGSGIDPSAADRGDDAPAAADDEDRDEIIQDWPQEALPGWEPPEAVVPVGAAAAPVLRYARAVPAEVDKRRRRGGRWMGVTALSLGAMALAGEGLIFVIEILRLGVTFEAVSLLLGLMVFVGFLSALVLGTLGRRNRDGRRFAEIGRLFAWLVPVPLIVAVAIYEFERPNVVLRVPAALALYVGVAFFITIVADAIYDVD